MTTQEPTGQLLFCAETSTEPNQELIDAITRRLQMDFSSVRNQMATEGNGKFWLWLAPETAIFLAEFVQVALFSRKLEILLSKTNNDLTLRCYYLTENQVVGTFDQAHPLYIYLGRSVYAGVAATCAPHGYSFTVTDDSCQSIPAALDFLNHVRNTFIHTQISNQQISSSPS